MRKKFYLFLVLAIVFWGSIGAQTAVTPKGNGSSSNPYQIESLSNLFWLSTTTSVWKSGYYFVQTANIDASSTQNWNSGLGFSPVGASASEFFTGYYDGGGYTISGLYINRPAVTNVGLFGYISKGSVENLGIVNCTISGGNNVGSIAGTSSEGEISSCYSTGTVSGSDKVGGLVAFLNTGIINGCFSSSTVKGSTKVGGLISSVYYGEVTNCYSDGSASGTNWVGGLAAEVSGEVSNSYSCGTVSGTDYIGGLVANNFADISNCYSYSKVTGKNWVGGLIGANRSGVISADYSFGSVSGSYIVGGLIGKNYSGVTITGSYYNSDLSGQQDTGKGIPLTTVQMQSSTSFKTLDFDGVTSDGTEDLWTVISSQNNGFPILLWQVIAEPNGSGTEDDPYLLSSLANLNWLSESKSVWKGEYYFVQTADIDASATKYWNDGMGFAPIGETYVSCFKGTYDGRGHIVDGLYINRPDMDNVGLIGYALSSDIKNTGVTNCDITGLGFVGSLIGFTLVGELTNSYSTGVVSGDHHVGGLGGKNDQGTVSYCYSSCDVTANNYSGGFFGGNYYGLMTDCYCDGSVVGINWVGGITGECSGTIKNCYTSCDVTGNDLVGGLIGNVLATISNCYSFSKVTGNNWIGGLIGANRTGVITNCYSFGPVSGSVIVGGFMGRDYSGGTISSCYYNPVLTDCGENGIGTPLTTKEMQTAATFVNWDFASSTSDGTEDIWTIVSSVNNGFPIFSWQVDGTTVVSNSVSGISFGAITEGSESAEDEIVSESFKVYPNPASDILYIDGSEGLATLYNFSGNKVLTYNLNLGNSIDISNLSAGVYILNVNGNNVKIIKQ